MDTKKKFEKYRDKAEKLLKENDKVYDLLASANSKVKSVIDNNEKLKEFTDKVSTFFRMVRAQLTGEYAHLPVKTIIMIVGALLYFVTPFDVIPDFIPGLGLTDDVAIVYWIYNSIIEDIQQFELWEKTINIDPKHEH